MNSNIAKVGDKVLIVKPGFKSLQGIVIEISAATITVREHFGNIMECLAEDLVNLTKIKA
jgi:hypothetical protein